MTLAEMLANQPPVNRIPGARSLIRQRLLESGRRIAVVDDDPTGTQTVHGVRVYFEWSAGLLRAAMSEGGPVFFISTNSRGLPPARAVEVSREVGQNLREAAAETGAQVVIASRSDSTLRGHYPYEVDALADGFGVKLDGVIVAPAFFEGGRFTIDDVHYVEQNGEMIPAHLTEFAKDPTFGFANSNLKKWIEEKTRGAVKAERVRSISLRTIREGGPEAVTRQFIEANDGEPIVVNAACYEDLDLAVLGLLEAESQGRTFAYRCAASFVKARGGFEDKPLLKAEELGAGGAPGLVAVGSYVERTSRQLEALLETGAAAGVELRVDLLLDSSSRDEEVRRAAEEAGRALRRGLTAAVYTSRETHLTRRAGFLDIGNAIMDGLCRAVSGVGSAPGFVIAKGGITSIEIARRALGIREGYVLGQILLGVPVLRTPPDTRWPGIPYVIFPGNVGDERSLARAVDVFASRKER